MKKFYLLIISFTFLFCLKGEAQMHTVIFENTGSYEFIVPCGVTEIKVEVWGSGGSGGRTDGTYYGTTGGGGGGAYSASVLSVSPGASYSVRVAEGKTDATGPVTYSSFGGTTHGNALVKAIGGSSAPKNLKNGGKGGLATAGTGDIRLDGKDGKDATNTKGGNGGNGGEDGFTIIGGKGGIGRDITAGEGMGGGGIAPGGGGGGALRIGSNKFYGGKGGDGMIVITYDGIPYGYCIPGFQQTRPITKVDFAGISNITSDKKNSPKYEQFCDIEGTVDKGAQYPITLQGNTDGNNSLYFTVFIDWNHNGEFELDERYDIGFIQNSNGTDKSLTENITVPINAETGKTVMRVIGQLNSYVSGACVTSKSGHYGQIEDYILNVNGFDCVQPVSIESIGGNIICLGSSLKLTQKDGNLPSDENSNWNWYKGTSASGELISGEKGTSIIVTPTETTDYYVEAIGESCTGTGATINIVVEHPVAISHNSSFGDIDQVICENSSITNIIFNIEGSVSETDVNGLTGSGLIGSFNNGEFQISGIGSNPGLYNYTVEVSSNCGVSGNASGTIEVFRKLSGFTYSETNGTYCANSSIWISPQFSVDTTYSNSTYEIISSPSLPSGLSLDPQTGVISGTTGTPLFTTKFTVKVSNGMCSDLTEDVYITITGGSINSYSITPDGNYEICKTGNVSLGLDGSDEDFLYQLYKDGNPIIGATATGISGNGQISFPGTYSEQGIYTIHLIPNQTNACSSLMVGSLEISRTTPADAGFSYSGYSFCQFEGGINNAILEDESSDGVFTASGGLIVDEKTGGIDFEGSAAGTYRITYTTGEGNCTNYSTKDITILNSALQYNIGTAGNVSSYCEGETGVTITLSGSELALNYKLYKEGNPDVLVDSKTGTGGLLLFNEITGSGNYYILASDNCNTPMNGEVMVSVNPIPDRPVINAAPGTICQGAILPLIATGQGEVAGMITVPPFEFLSAPIDVPNNSSIGMYAPITVTGIPDGAVIEDIIITFDIEAKNNSNKLDALAINLKGPNGNVLSIRKEQGNGGGAKFDSTKVSMTSTDLIPDKDNSNHNYANGPYKAQGGINVQGATSLPNNKSNVSEMSDLLSTDGGGANGVWILSVYDSKNNSGALFNYWSITIVYKDYSEITGLGNTEITWAPGGELYLDPAATDTYLLNTVSDIVYSKPTTNGTKTYTAISTNEFGCSNSEDIEIVVNPSPELTLAPDYCSDIKKGNFIIRADTDLDVNKDTWNWSGENSAVITTNKRYSTLKDKISGVYYVSVLTDNYCLATGSIRVGTELIKNGDFELINEDIESVFDYIEDPGFLSQTGVYTVAKDPNLYEGNFWGVDHTFADGTGNFMIIKGNSNANSVVWKQTVLVEKGKKYNFSAFAVSLSQTNLAQLKVTIDGITVIDNMNLAGKPSGNFSGVWTHLLKENWVAPDNGEVEIQIIDKKSNSYFAIDDISFASLDPFFRYTGAPVDKTDQIFCANSELSTISFEAGGTGSAPSVTWTNGKPEGVDSYWNGRDILIRGIPEDSGEFEFSLSFDACGTSLTDDGLFTVKSQPTPGIFKDLDATFNAIPVCYNSTPTIELDNTEGAILKWQRFDGSNWVDITGSAGETDLEITNPIADSFSLRAYAQQIGTDGITPVKGCEEAVSVVKIDLKNVWRGNDGEDWNRNANWSFETIPAIGCEFVLIPEVSSNDYPFLKTSEIIQVPNLVIWDGAQVGLEDGSTLRVSGNITQVGAGKTGHIDALDGTVEFNGTTAQTISGEMFLDTTILNMVIANNSSGLSVSNSGKPVAITNKISFPSSGGKLMSGDNIVLRSTKERTAILGQLTSSSTVSGQFTVERYINTGTDPGQHGKKWMHLATPATGQTIKQSWMENGQSTQGYGVYLTGPDGNDWDAYSPAPAVKEYDEGTNKWLRASGADRILYNPKGWQVYVRGDRTVTKATDDPKPTVLRAKGTLKTHAQNFTVLAADNSIENWFTSIGNPYASAIDMREVLTGPDEVFIVWDPNSGEATGSGAYRTLTKVGYDFEEVPGNIGTIDNFIPSGQGFFVQKGIASRTLQVTETAKGEMPDNLTFFRKAGTGGSTIRLLRANIYRDDVLLDGTLHIFGSEYSNEVDDLDGRKMLNSGLNLSAIVDNKLLVVERRKLITKSDTLHFNLTGTTNGTYRFTFNSQNLSGPGVNAWVEDVFANRRTPIDLEGETEVEFEVTSAPESKAADRFMVVFDAPEAGALPVMFVNVKAEGDGNIVNVLWTVANESNVKHYVVMASADGSSFRDIAVINADGSVDYGTVDETPVKGYNYYRIRSLDLDGALKYSQIVKVFIGDSQPRISVFPNPVTHGKVQLHLENHNAGIYRLKLINPAGQVMLMRDFNHPGGNYTEVIPWDYKMAHGSYHLEVTQPDGTKKVIVIMY